MASRFACIATSRRRRALSGSLGASSARRRRASASLRRASDAWPDGGAGTSLLRRDGDRSTAGGAFTLPESLASFARR
jgi:hypothetical protein